MTDYEKPAVSLYRNVGKEGVFAETFLRPLNIRKPNEIESLDIDKVTLKAMMAEAHKPPGPPRRELDIQALYKRHRKHFVADGNTSTQNKITATGLVVAGVGIASSTLSVFF